METRRFKYGLNKLGEQKRTSLFVIFFQQLHNVLIYILLGAAALSFGLGELSDGIIIIAVVLINGIIGVIQEAGRVVLTDDNFNTMVKAVEEGRNIYKNLKKTITFLLSCNAGEIVAIFAAILMGWTPPLRGTRRRACSQAVPASASY